jgi:hypothetical protein
VDTESTYRRVPGSLQSGFALLDTVKY